MALIEKGHLTKLFSPDFSAATALKNSQPACGDFITIIETVHVLARKNQCAVKSRESPVGEITNPPGN
jgi:hypothetical protein